MNSIIYRKAETKDINDIARVHEAAFRNFFLTTLGNSFLRVYYKACIRHKDSIVICAVDDRGCICGFASGSISANGYYKKILLFSLIPFFIEIIKLIFKRPNTIIRLALNLNKSKNALDRSDYAELLSIAIKPEMKGSGVGMTLLDHFEREVMFNGSIKLALTTDYENNERVVNFYKKCGYQVFYCFVTYPNRKMYKLIKEL